MIKYIMVVQMLRNSSEISSAQKCIQQKCLYNYKWIDKIQDLKNTNFTENIEPIKNAQPAKKHLTQQNSTYTYTKTFNLLKNSTQKKNSIYQKLSTP